MNDINNGYDRHLDPPDEEEAVICEYCNQEMELCTKGYTHFTCENQFCPEKFEKYKGGTISVVLDMSNHLAEVEQELADLHIKYNAKSARLLLVQSRIEKLTQSQSNVVVRDTEYQIQRMEDCIEYAYIDCNLNGEGYRGLKKEWAEVKKILESYG